MKNIYCEFMAGVGAVVRPRWGRDIILTFTVGCTHGYPCCCPLGSRSSDDPHPAIKAPIAV